MEHACFVFIVSVKMKCIKLAFSHALKTCIYRSRTKCLMMMAGRIIGSDQTTETTDTVKQQNCQWVLNWHIFFLLMWPDCLHGPGRCFCSPLRSAPQRPPMEYPTECSSWSEGHRPLGLPGWAFSQPDMTNVKAPSWTYEVKHYHKRFIL